LPPWLWLPPAFATLGALHRPEGIAVWKDCMQAFQESSTEFTALLSEYDVKNEIKLLKTCKRLLKNDKNIINTGHI
jgi:hypothetical protein